MHNRLKSPHSNYATNTVWGVESPSGWIYKCTGWLGERKTAAATVFMAVGLREGDDVQKIRSHNTKHTTDIVLFEITSPHTFLFCW